MCHPVNVCCFWDYFCFWNCFRNRSTGQVTFRTHLQLSAPPWKPPCPLGIVLVGTHPHLSPPAQLRGKGSTAEYLLHMGCIGTFPSSKYLRSSRRKDASCIQPKQMWDIWVKGKEEEKYQWLLEQSCYYWVISKKRPLWEKLQSIANAI